MTLKGPEKQTTKLTSAKSQKMFGTCYISLKVGSWSFKGIIILLIYFLNCQKALRKKNISVKSIKLKVLD